MPIAFSMPNLAAIALRPTGQRLGTADPKLRALRTELAASGRSARKFSLPLFSPGGRLRFVKPPHHGYRLKMRRLREEIERHDPLKKELFARQKLP